MPKYINADQFERDCMFDRECEDMQDVIYKLRDYPSADVVEVKHGKNLNNEYAECDQFVCSECGIELLNWDKAIRDEDGLLEFYGEFIMKFCPNCGADMRGEEK